MKTRNVLFVPLLFAGQALFAQTDSTKIGTSSAEPVSDSTAANVFEMSLEDLMDVKVVSASKKAESTFEAPLSIGSVSKDEIKRAGATSIPEALRLIPGLIVRETSNGNYDVHIRGFTNLPPASVLSNATNSTILVMIDSRPVYNYFSGGTFWETLPVDLNDVERIEVVRGPSSALYGPNAANGVINIITRHAQKEGVYSVANIQRGTYSTFISNASVGYKKDKFDLIVSGNYQNRNRFESDYYSWLKGNKVPLDSVQVAYPLGPMTDVNRKPNTDERYPDPSLSLAKYGYNAFANYAVNPNASIGLAVGGQQSTAQVAYIENLATPLSFRTSSTNYADLRGKLYGLTAQVAVQGGKQNASKGYNGYEYDFHTIDALAEYDINFLKYFSVKPGINYRTATYDDSKYTDISQQNGFINGSRTLDNAALSIRGEFDSKSFVKLIAAARYDKYNYPSDGYLSYQLGANFKVNDRNLIRGVLSRSYRGPTMYDTYNSQSIYVLDVPIEVVPGLYRNFPAYAQTRGNKELNLQKIFMAELGYRLKATDFLHFDLELFYQTSENYSISTNTKQIFVQGRIIIPQAVQNISLKAEQTGGTLGLNFLYGKFQFKPSITVQQTFLTKVPVDRDSATVNTNTYDDKSSSSAPSWYGSAYLNYQLHPKLNINLNAYYYGAYTYVNIYNTLGSTPEAKANGISNISEKVLLSAKVGYKIIDNLELFVSGRNLLNATSQEFANTDVTKFMFLGGANFEF